MKSKMFPLGEMGKYAIISSKGSTVVSYIVDNTVIIFPQQAIGSKYRGGIPICFPFFGNPKQKFTREISKHGWLRDQEFTLYKEKENSLVLRSFMNGRIKETYPWAFMYDVEIFILPERSLALELRVTRLDDGIRGLAPVNPAFHPYFCNSGRKAVIIGGQAWLAENSTSATIVPARKEILIDTGVAQIKMSLGGDFNEKSCVALWTDDAQKYFCVEPILTHPDDFDTPKGKFLKVGQVLNLHFSLSVFS